MKASLTTLAAAALIAILMLGAYAHAETYTIHKTHLAKPMPFLPGKNLGGPGGLKLDTGPKDSGSGPTGGASWGVAPPKAGPATSNDTFVPPGQQPKQGNPWKELEKGLTKELPGILGGIFGGGNGGGGYPYPPSNPGYPGGGYGNGYGYDGGYNNRGYGNGGYGSGNYSNVPGNAVPNIAQHRLVVRNPASNGGDVTFLLRGRQVRLASGTQRDLKIGSRELVSFNRGQGMGTARYTIKPGTYVFRAKESGWDMFRKPARIVIDNSQNEHRFTYRVGNQLKRLPSGATASHASTYPIQVVFDPGNGGQPVTMQLLRGNYLVSLNDAQDALVLRKVVPTEQDTTNQIGTSNSMGINNHVGNKIGSDNQVNTTNQVSLNE